jgi:hypothetical protein
MGLYSLRKCCKQRVTNNHFQHNITYQDQLQVVFYVSHSKQYVLIYILTYGQVVYLIYPTQLYTWYYHIGGVMVRAWPRVRFIAGQTIDYKIGICCFSAKHAALRRRSNDWLARKQDVSELGDMSIYNLWTVVSVS